MEGIEMICFNIISNVGLARSSYIEAIQKAKKGLFEEAQELVEAGQAQFLKGHEAHMQLLEDSSGGSSVAEGGILLMHAEDQLMSAEAFKIIAQEMMDSYRRIIELENKVKGV